MDTRQPCRALDLDGLPCMRPINPIFSHCGRHGDNPLLVPRDSELMRNWSPNNWNANRGPIVHEHFVIAERRRKGVKDKTVYNSNQTVHATSISSSALNSANHILSFLPPNASTSRYIEKITPWWNIWNTRLRLHIKYLCATESKIQSILFRELFCAGVHYATIQKTDTQKLIVERIRTELTDGIGYCLQGNCVRFVNAFVGFMDNVQVGVSDAEQVQSAFAKLANDDSPLEEKQMKGKSILKELQIPENQWNNWLNAL